MSVALTTSNFETRIRPACQGRISGCQMGKAVELLSMREERTTLTSYLHAADALPIRDYIPLVPDTSVARRDAELPHRGEGVYGAMAVAAISAAIPACGTLAEAVATAVELIPADSDCAAGPDEAAVRLFIDRAASATGSFEPDTETIDIIAERSDAVVILACAIYDALTARGEQTGRGWRGSAGQGNQPDPGRGGGQSPPMSGDERPDHPDWQHCARTAQATPRTSPSQMHRAPPSQEIVTRVWSTYESRTQTFP